MMASRFSIILFIIWGCAIQDTLPYAQQSRWQKTPPSHQYSSNNSPEYGLQTVYTASAYVPIDHTGPPLRIVPETQKTEYFFVASNKTEQTIPSISTSSLAPIYMPPSKPNEVFKNHTFVPQDHHDHIYTHNYQQEQPTQHHQQYFQPQKEYNQPFNLKSHSNFIHHSHSTQHHHHHNKHQHPQNQHYLKNRRLRHRTNGGSSGDCIKCPPEKILIAQKGLDGVLIEQPKLFSCNNRAILNTAYYIETLFGPNFKFLLPHGAHSLHGKIKSKRTGKVIQNCMLRYKVIVQQCGRFFSQDSNIKVKCDPSHIWGSKCTFSCRQGYLSTDKPMMCGDTLHWEGEEPECLPHPPIEESQSCDFLGIPDNGKFSCEYPSNINTNDFENELVTPDGTLCRVKCNRNYEIPANWESYGILKCQNGRWNATLPNLCQPKKRYSYFN